MRHVPSDSCNHSSRTRRPYLGRGSHTMTSLVRIVSARGRRAIAISKLLNIQEDMHEAR